MRDQRRPSGDDDGHPRFTILMCPECGCVKGPTVEHYDHCRSRPRHEERVWERVPAGRVRPRVVCLCGSTRFASEFNLAAERLTLEGEIVVRPEVVAYSRAKDPQLVAPDVKARLDELHLRKIDLADWVLVINVDGYIGDSTRREIQYAEQTEKPVRYLVGHAEGKP